MSCRDKVNTSGCHFCARQTDIQAHHIVPDRFGGRDTRENLVGVCERCHKKLERLYDKRFYERLGIKDEKGERKAHFPCLRCENTADVKLRSPAGISHWFCLRCGTDKFNSDVMMGRDTDIVEDLSGRLSHRKWWIRGMKSGRVRGANGGVA